MLHFSITNQSKIAYVHAMSRWHQQLKEKLQIKKSRQINQWKSNYKDREMTRIIGGEKTNFGPGKTALYFHNKGLFSDPFLEDRLPQLEKYYTSPSTRFLNEYWNIDESDANKYNRALQGILNLWHELDQDIPKFCSKERQLQNSWIDKIFAILGWTYELEESSSKHGVTNFPDYTLFASKEDWKSSKNLTGNNKFKRATAVADAKAWGVNLDGKGFSNQNPSFQIINYLKQTDKKWGILTDGKYWRIYSVRSESKHTTYYEIDLEKILAGVESEDGFERFKYFYNFFRAEAFVEDARLNDRCFLDFVFEDGKVYSQRVENNLQERVYKVVDTICRGFLDTNHDSTEQDLKEVYEYSMYYLFKLMFVLNCESKGLLEVNKQDDYYAFSLRKMCMEIKEQFESGKNWSRQPKTYNQINDLFTLLKMGDSKIGVHGFGEEPFEIGSEEFYRKYRISDEHLNHALLELSCDYDEEDNLQFIDYKILSPDHIGSLFEGLLEFNLVKKDRKVELLNTKGDRKATGSYYTPEYLVDYIVQEVVSPLIIKKDVGEITKLKILDPAMGSGHFLLGVVKFLEKEITEIQDSNEKVKGAIEFDKIRKEVLKNCVFGIDINPLATQLAKFSLWIYTSQKGDTLEPLNDQLLCSNSLLDSFNWERNFNQQVSNGLFDAIVGNPPYIGEKGNKPMFDEIKGNLLGKFYQGKMDYFYFFYHLALNQVKDSGRIGFITTNYFVTATGATTLRSDLKTRASIERVINFNEMKIFKSAQGQHNILMILKKGKNKDKCLLHFAKEGGALTSNLFDLSSKDLFSTCFVSQAELFDTDENYMRTDPEMHRGSEAANVLVKMLKCKKNLSNEFEIDAGIQTGADRVSNRHLKMFPSLKATKNEGIFVLTKDEIKNKSWGAESKKFLKPWFKNSDIKRFNCTLKTDKFVILTNFISDLKRFPEIMKHITPYKDILLSRGQMEHCLDWWDLHQIRMKDKNKTGEIKKMIFDKPKIVCPQRASINKFAFNEGPWFASVDVYFITHKEDNAEYVKAVCSLLNSKIYYLWLFFKGKKKGKALEMYKKPLGEIPIPELTRNEVKLLANIYDLISSDISAEKALNDLEKFTYKKFELSEEDIECVNSLYPGVDTFDNFEDEVELEDGAS